MNDNRTEIINNSSLDYNRLEITEDANEGCFQKFELYRKTIATGGKWKIPLEDKNSEIINGWNKYKCAIVLAILVMSGWIPTIVLLSVNRENPNCSGSKNY